MRKAEYDLPTSLRGIALKAVRCKDWRFDNLYGLLTVKNLEWCYFRLRKKAAAGVDKVTWKDYGNNLRENLEDLVERLKRKSYHARMVKRQYIPKINGKLRPLGIPALEDKIVQFGVSKILEAIFEQEFLPFSYGYRPKIGATDAVKDLTFELQFGRFGWLVEADIKGFFDNIDHKWLIKMLSLKIRDKAFLNLIKKWLKAGILDTDGKVLHPVTGTPQGGICSPVLANVYLHYALDLWFQKCVKPQVVGRAMLVRYADDFVACFQYKHEAEKYYRTLDNRLLKFGLEIEPSKTNMLKFSRFDAKNGEQFEFLGFSFRWKDDRSGKPRVTRTTSKKKYKASLANFTVWIKEKRNTRINRWMKTLQSKLRGYWNYYGVHGNSRMLWAFWWQVVLLIWKWLNRRSQRRSYNLKGIFEMLAHFKIPKPRITEKPAARREIRLYI